MGYQLAAATTCAAWSFVISIILLFIINKIPGCHIRATEEEELRGLDYKYFSDVEEDLVVLNGYGSARLGESGLGVVSSGEGSHQDIPVDAGKRD